MKKIALILIAVLLVSSLFACNETEADGDSYGGVSSYSNSTRVENVVVNGEVVASFTYIDGSGKSAIITGYTGSVDPHEVVVPETVGEGDAILTVKEIGAEAFYYRTAITAITLPATIEKIGNMAFAGCTGLKSITIPASTLSIGDYAFARCYSLKSVSFGKDSKLETIGDLAFDECTALETIKLPSNLKHIGNGSFRMCEKLESIKTPASLLSIGDMPFKGCTKLNFPGAVDVSESVNIEEVYVEKDGKNVLVPNLGQHIFSGIEKENIVAPKDPESHLAKYIAKIEDAKAE